MLGGGGGWGDEWGGGPLTIAAGLGLGAAGERREGRADAADGWWLDDATRTHAARTHAGSRAAMAVGGAGRGIRAQARRPPGLPRRSRSLLDMQGRPWTVST